MSQLWQKGNGFGGASGAACWQKSKQDTHPCTGLLFLGYIFFSNLFSFHWKVGSASWLLPAGHFPCFNFVIGASWLSKCCKWIPSPARIPLSSFVSVLFRSRPFSRCSLSLQFYMLRHKIGPVDNGVREMSAEKSSVTRGGGNGCKTTSTKMTSEFSNCNRRMIFKVVRLAIDSKH